MNSLGKAGVVSRKSNLLLRERVKSIYNAGWCNGNIKGSCPFDAGSTPVPVPIEAVTANLKCDFTSLIKFLPLRFLSW